MNKYIVKQEDETDCGSCCLLSIIKYYNGYVPLEIIKEDTITNNNGTTFFNLKEAAIKYGFEVKGEKQTNLNTLICPYIVQLNMNNINHFVVVYKYENNITLMDPSSGIKAITKDEFNKVFTGYILDIKPINRIVCYEKKNPLINVIIPELKANYKSLIFILLLSIIIVIISLLITYGIKIIISKHFSFLMILFILAIVLKIIFNYIKNSIIAHLNKKFNIYLLSNYIEHIFKLSFKYIQLKKTGDFTTRINDLITIKNFFTNEIVNILINSLFVINSFIILILLNKYISFIIIILSIIYITVSINVNKKIYNLYLLNIDSETTFMDYTIEYINKIKTIKTLNKVDFFFNKLKKNIITNNNNFYSLEKYLNFSDLINNIYNELSFITIIVVSLFIHSNISDMLIYILFYNYFSDSIKYFMNLIPNLMYFKASFNKISGLYYLREEEVNKGLKFINGDIIINNLSYKINLNSIFNYFNTNIKLGDKVLIIGSNGSGKSTLLNIIYKNIDNYKGIIKINNNDLNNTNSFSLRNNISYVSQNDDLFTDTILNNIILNKSYNKIKMDNINNIVELDSIINKKIYGINSIVNNNLSGGERQRIILARALYQDFNILLLDEALSEISHYLRLKIINNLNKEYANKTIIYVSHNYEKYPFNKIINLTVRKELIC